MKASTISSFVTPLSRIHLGQVLCQRVGRLLHVLVGVEDRRTGELRRHHLVKIAAAAVPGAPYNWVKPTFGSPGTWRSSASPRSCRTISWICRSPEAPIGSPLAISPPSVLTGIEPVISV